MASSEGSKRPRLAAQGDNDACLVSVVAILAKTGFVGAKEILVLSRASKQVHQACLEDAVWAPLCQSRWPCTKDLPKSILDHGSYLQLYKEWNAGVAQAPSYNQLPPPSCSPSEICLFVHVAHKGKSLVSLKICGEEILPLLEVGHVNFELGSPAIVGKATWNCSDNEFKSYPGRYDSGLPIKCDDLDLTALDASVHCFRSTDSAMVCLLRSSKPSDVFFAAVAHPLVKEGEAISRSCGFDFSRPHVFYHLAFPNLWSEPAQVPPLQQSQMATEILSRMRELVVCFELRLQLTLFDPDQVVISSIGVTAHSDERNKHHEPSSGQIFCSLFETVRHGVSLLHILSELQGANTKSTSFSNSTTS